MLLPIPPQRPPRHSAVAAVARVARAAEKIDQFQVSTQIASIEGDLQAARERASKRYGAIPGVRIEVCSCAANGNKPVIVLQKMDRDPATPPRAQLHFHGDQFADTQIDYDGHIGPTVQRAWDKDGSLIFILPEAKNESSGPRVDWSNVGDVGQLLAQALQASGIDGTPSQEKILSGHSAGGSPVARALASGTVEFSRIELYDAAVGSSLNPISDAERSRVEAYTRSHEGHFVYVPGVMTDSSWLKFIDADRLTVAAPDHWTALWDSLGQHREPKSDGSKPCLG